MKTISIALCTRMVIFGIFFLFMGGVVGVVRADTGTYTVSHEYADLTIQTDGNVVIQYDIAMSVLSGNIPWVTVGLPDSKYQIRTFGGSAVSVDTHNSGSWSGVYVTLDRTYYADETFQFSFEVLQNDFVYKYNDNQASISFTPCWWDNAVTDDLKVTIFIPTEITSGVITATQPTRYEGSSIIWEYTDVAQGARKSTGARMPLSAFSHVGSSAPGSSFQLPSWICDTTYLIPIVFVIIFILGAVARGRSRRSPYEEPQMSSGGFRALLRHINLDCPNDGMRLQRRNIQGTTIDFCEHCGGVYFDQGEIETLIEKGVNETQFNTTQVPSFSGYATPGTNICPRCHGTFEKITKTSDGRNASIYACKECKGIWVNKGIYQIIKEKRIDQDKEQQDKLRLVGDKESDKKQAVNAPSWWWFYPYIYYPRQYNRYIAPAPPVVHHSCACVSCACAGGCACACACAGGGAAGCAPKDTIYPQISFR